MKDGDILRQAADLIEGDRAREHGDFHELAKDVALLWELHLRRVHGVSVCLDGWDIGRMLADLKHARALQNRDSVDNPTDETGYLALATKEAKRYAAD